MVCRNLLVFHPHITYILDQFVPGLHGCDPDVAEASARRLGFTVISPATTKGHGLREAYLQDGDGYVWAPDVPPPAG